VELEEKLQETQTARQASEDLVREYRELRDRAREQERQIKRRVRTEVRAAVDKAATELNEIMTPIKIRKAATRENVTTARERLREFQVKINDQYGDALEGGLVPDWPQVKAGDRVQVLPLGVEAEIIRAPGSEVGADTEIKVRIGKLQVSVEAGRIRTLPHQEEPSVVLKPKLKKERRADRKKPPQPTSPAPAQPGPYMPQTAKNTLDLRGQRVYEAEAEVDKFLDDSCRAHLANVYIIHGHGTGALKQVVREILGLSLYVDSFRPGEQNEGGDGVTVVMLKEWGYSNG